MSCQPSAPFSRRCAQYTGKRAEKDQNNPERKRGETYGISPKKRKREEK